MPSKNSKPSTTRKAVKRSPSPQERRTAALPASILRVRKNVTEAQAHAMWDAGDVERVRALIGVRYLVAQGKAKTVRETAEAWGVGKSTVDRANRAADLVWRIGSTATSDDAQHAIALANSVSSDSIGQVSAFVKDDVRGADLSKALPAARAKAAAAVKKVREAKAKKASPSASKATTTPADDKTRVRSALTLLANTKDASKVDSQDVLSVLAHAMRLAVGCPKVEPSEIADEIAAALKDAPALITAAADGKADDKPAAPKVTPAPKATPKASKGKATVAA